MLSIIFIGTVWFLLIAPFLQGRRRKALMTQPLAPHLKDLAWKNVPVLARLPADLQRQLEGLMNIFLAEKKFTGFEGLEITDEIRATIAAQACLLLLNRKTSLYKHLTNIFVYPAAFTSRQKRQDGVLVHEDAPIRSGESWALGPVILSWRDCLHGSLFPHDGHNVVFHEFAHQLDQEDGQSDGFPVLGTPEKYKKWAQVLEREYQTLREKTQRQDTDLIDPYGATNPAEFFAVITEVFFEQPKTLKEAHPALYDQLSEFYHLDMANLTPN